MVQGFLGGILLSLANASHKNRANVTPPSLCSILVKDIIPLGGPPCHRAKDRGRAHPVPQCLSQETNKKPAHTLKHLYPLLQCTPPHQTSVLERRNRSAIAVPSSSKKIFAGGQESLSNYNVPMGKVQLNNNHHLNNDGSCQSAGKKDAPLQRQGSYDEQKEFAFAFCKQLNENLKVTKRYSDVPQIPFLKKIFFYSLHNSRNLPVCNVCCYIVLC